MPPIAFWKALKTEKKIVVSALEPYRKQSFRNRTVILNSMGRQILSVPVSCPFGKETKTLDVNISYQEDWQKDHFRSLCTAYNKSPYFLYYRDEIEAILFANHKRLVDLNLAFIEFFTKIFGVENLVEYCLNEGFGEVFSNKDPKLFSEFSVKETLNNYQNTFLHSIQDPSTLSSCDFLCNYGKWAFSHL